MHNQYKNGTEAWWAMKGAMDVETTLQEAMDSMCDTYEDIIGVLDETCEQRDEALEERDQLQTEFDELNKKFEEFDTTELIAMLKELRNAATTLATYCEAKLRKIDVQEGSDDSGSGTPGDGGG